MKNFLRVAQVIGSAQGGVMSCVMNYYRHIDRTKVQFDFFTYEAGPYDEEIASLGGRVFHFPNIFKPSAVKTLEKYFRQNNYDIVHAHMTTRSVFALKAAKRAGVAVRVCHAHSTTHPQEGVAFVAKSILKHFSTLYATNLAGCSQKSIQWLYGKHAESAFLLKNAIDTQKFRYVKRPGNSVPTVGFVGRFVFQKNLFFLLDVFKQLLKRRSDVQLVLVGEGRDKKALQKYAQKIAPEKILFFPERQDVEKCYAHFDVFVLTSRFEGLPLVAVEAQSCGNKCLLADTVTQEVDVGGYVRFLPLGNASLWAAQLDEMLRQPQPEPAETALYGYDIALEAHKLQDYYFEITDK